MSLIKFLRIIDSSFVGKAIDKRVAIIQATDPRTIYVENVRRFFNLPFGVARFFCNMAVKEGLFIKKIGVYCPNCSRMLISVDSKEEIPDSLECEICSDMEEHRHVYNKAQMSTMEFYQMNKKTA